MNFENRSSRNDVAILGGGVIGLSIAWRLAQAGMAVTLVERGALGRGASWAAAGMLAAGIEAEPTEEPLFELGRWSQSLWPDFAAELEAESGLPAGYRETGTLVCAFTRDQAAKLRHGVEFQRRLGGEFELLSGAAARDLEPGLSGHVVQAVWSPHDHQADNRLLGVALAEACRRAGVSIVTGVDAEIVVEGGRAVGLAADGSFVSAQAVVLAAGAWSRDVRGLPDAVRPPVRPIKGQMLSVTMPEDSPLIERVVWGAACYLVPRADRTLIIGATTEERGFDPAITAGGMLALLDDAWRTLPGIEECPIRETWVGFRPGSPDDMPILGASELPGLVLATGHHRNGILLTPATASLISTLLLTGRADPRLAAFGPDRFQRREAA